MDFWLFLSRANVAPRSSEEAMIYLRSRTRNTALGITGYLHREGGYYAQYIEGPRAGLRDVMRLVRNDWRHSDLRDLSGGTVETRVFPGWDMALTDTETRAWRTSLGGGSGIEQASAEEIVRFMELQAANRGGGPVSRAG